MKKTAFVLLAALLALSFSACGGAPDAMADTTGADTTTLETTMVDTTMVDTVTADTAPTAGGAAVYMTAEVTPEGLQAVYEALGTAPGDGDKVAVKVSTGEPPASNYLRRELIGDFVRELGGTYVECNTAYGGQRTATAMHYQVAADHGFEPIVLMDDEGDMEIPVEGGLRLKADLVGKKTGDFNFHVVLSHFKGHQMAGYGGALKQLSIGYGSFRGKNMIHSGGKSADTWAGAEQDAFLEAMADASKGVIGYIKNLEGGQLIYINVMNRLSVDCDCNGNPAEPDIHDIGILASLDPVALDKACLDLVYAAEGSESFIRRVEAQNGAHVIEAAEALGIGSSAYTLESVDG